MTTYTIDIKPGCKGKEKYSRGRDELRVDYVPRDWFTEEQVRDAYEDGLQKLEVSGEDWAVTVLQHTYFVEVINIAQVMDILRMNEGWALTLNSEGFPVFTQER